MASPPGSLVVSRDGLQGQSQAYGSLGDICSLSEGQPWKPVTAQTRGAGPEACLEQPGPGLVPGAAGGIPWMMPASLVPRPALILKEP